MNSLLIIPRMIQEDGGKYYFPIGIPYISAALKAHGFKIYCLNLNEIRSGDISKILETNITENNIDIVATGAFSHFAYNIKYIIDTAKQIQKKQNRRIITVVGGAVITTEPLIMAKYFDCDFGVLGEGEDTAVELWKRLEENIDTECNDISGLVYKCGNDYIFTEPRRTLVDIERLPIPDYEGFGMKTYLSRYNNFNRFNSFIENPRQIDVMGSRACPFRCTFCYHSVGDRFRMRSVNSIISEIEYYIKTFQINIVFFLDDVLFTEESRMEELCVELERLKVKFFMNLRVTSVNEQILKRLKDAGCINVGYGLESHSQKILNSMKKYLKLEDMDRALDLTYKAKLSIQGNFIFGDIAETMETAIETIKWHQAHQQYTINIAEIFTAPGAEIYDYAKKKGLIKDVLSFILKKDYIINLTSMSGWEHKKFRNLIHWYRVHCFDNVICRGYIYLDYNASKKLFTVRENHLDKKQFSYVVYCPHCGERNEYNNLPIIDVLACKSCLHFFPVYYSYTSLRNISFFSFNMGEIFTKIRPESEVYIFGTNIYSKAVYEYLKTKTNIKGFVNFKNSEKFAGGGGTII